MIPINEEMFLLKNITMRIQDYLHEHNSASVEELHKHFAKNDDEYKLMYIGAFIFHYLLEKEKRKNEKNNKENNQESETTKK